MFHRRKLKSLDDEQLILRYQESGDVAYVGELFQRYTHGVFLTCMKYLKDEMESEDVSMQVFEKLMEDLKKYDIKSFKYWLHTVVKNQCLLVVERKKKERKKREHWQQTEQPDMALQPAPDALRGAALREVQLSRLEQALKQLNEEQQKCLELFYLQQKCYKDVSQETGYSMKQVKSYIQNGKRNLKKLLTQLPVNE